MLAMNFSNARQNFKKVCDTVVEDFETVVITRKQGENVVMMSESEYNNLMENLFIARSKKNYEHILESIEQLERGQYKIKELIEDGQSE